MSHENDTLDEKNDTLDEKNDIRCSVVNCISPDFKKLVSKIIKHVYTY